jgi:hypothetical protein
MRPMAVRAWVLRKFNPDLTWAKTADLLFVRNGRCPRTVSEGKAKVKARACNVQQHESHSECVKALQRVVNDLIAAMKGAGISSEM